MVNRILSFLGIRKVSHNKPVYSEKDMADLYLYFLRKPDSELFTSTTLNRVVYSLRYLHLYRLLHYKHEKIILDLYEAHEIEFYRIVHEVPLKEIPLYINTHPEIARWRLSVGK